MAVDPVQLLANLPWYIQTWFGVLVLAVILAVDGQKERIPFPSNRERYGVAVVLLILMSVLVVVIEKGVVGMVVSVADWIVAVTIIGAVLFKVLGLSRD